MKLYRRLFQISFLLLTLLSVFVLKSNAERWCPFGGVEALYSYIREGSMICSLGVSSFYALAGLLLSVLLLRRAFCGYVCPIGAISELLRAGAAKLRLPGLRVTGKWDRGLALLKYAVLGLILWGTWTTSELVFRAYDPCYALIGRHGADITFWAYVVSGSIVVASIFILLPFCRWFCPLAAVMSPLSRFSFSRIKRNEETCTGCAKCTRVCPAAITVHKMDEVTAARCLTCTECIDVCPENEGDDGALSWGPPSVVARQWPRGVVVAILLLLITGVGVAAYLAPMPAFVASRGQLPDTTAVLHLRLHELTCRGRANLLVSLLDRDDMFGISGATPGSAASYKLEAWPDPGIAEVRITYDPRYVDEGALKQAILQPYYDLEKDLWFKSPFRVEGQPAPAPAL